MQMEYEINPDGVETEHWMFRFYADGQLCGKLCLGTVEKDNLKTKLDELGWVERT